MTNDRRRPAPVAAEHLASDATIARLAEQAVVNALAAARPTQVARLAAHKTIVGLSEDAGCEPTWLANAVFDAIADVGGVVHDSSMDSSDAQEEHDAHMKRARAYHRKWLEELADLVTGERHRSDVDTLCGWHEPHVPTAPLLEFIARKESEL